MPFSSLFEQQFIDLVETIMARVTFKNKEDFSLFCQMATSGLIDINENNAIAQQSKSSVYDEIIRDLQELIDEGFDLYATKNIVDN